MIGVSGLYSRIASPRSALAVFFALWTCTTLAQVNRTVPKVNPPNPTLKFSAHPTALEISRAGVFQEPLVPIGGEPTREENAALAVALLDYAHRSRPDDFGSLEGFLASHPNSPWNAALFAGLGVDYYSTAHYSLALEAWEKGWRLGQSATDTKGKLLTDRAVCELAGLYSRLGRMMELEALLKSIEGRVFLGGASERINIAREVLDAMKHRPEVCFRCGPLALQSIKRSLDPLAPPEVAILNSKSTTNGFSLSKVAEISAQIGLNYRMAFRTGGEFIVPSVVHWRVGHYAAIVRTEGDRYLLQDPTFGTTVWATREALEAESSGYFLAPPGGLPTGWRAVENEEGEIIHGKGTPSLSDGDIYCFNDLQTGSCPLSSSGMAVSSVHLMLANLQIRDTPVGYSPPLGPSVRFRVRYNQRDYLSGVETLLGPKWTHDWMSYIKDEPRSPLADVKFIVGGGGARTFTAFKNTTQTFAPNQYDQTLLKRTGTNSYEMTWPDGSKMIFSQSDGALGTFRRVFLTAVADPRGNRVTLSWERLEFANAVEFRLVALTDALGQVTLIHYEDSTHPFLITRVEDPFGRAARFEYTNFVVGYFNPTSTNYLLLPLLTGIQDVLGLPSRFSYRRVGSDPQTGTPIVSDQIASMTTPYGTTSFVAGGGTNANHTLFRFVETHYPDGSSERVEFNQSDTLGIPNSDPVASVPAGMEAQNQYLYGRNTYYWSRTAQASSGGSHTHAKIFHWLHTSDLTSTAGILASVKEPLEGRIWFDYLGGSGIVAGMSDRPLHIGRVLDDGQTQLFTRGYNSFGKLTNSVDPLGRTFSLLYATNGIDLLEVRQTRATNNESLFRATYDSQHHPLTVVDAAGQSHRFIYNDRGQVVASINAKGQTATYSYTPDGYLAEFDGPLPGNQDVSKASYDEFGRVRTLQGPSGYTLMFDYDVMNRLTRITHPDSSFEQFAYDRLEPVIFQDRAGRQITYEYDAMRQLKKRTDPLGRVTRFDWCRCGQIKSLTDSMGRTTSWLTDVQGRTVAKQYPDGSQVKYQYENTIRRLRFVIDTKEQVTQYEWNRDNTLKSLAYGNALIPTPGVSFIYDSDYKRVVTMTDGNGSTRYSYKPIPGTPMLGAGGLASIDGPLPDDTILYDYDELGRRVATSIDGVGIQLTFDDARRLVNMTNGLGTFAYGYDGSTTRLISKTMPNGQKEERSYSSLAQEGTLKRITHKVGTALISEFLYDRDVSKGRVTTWSQQAGTEPPMLFSFSYDADNQLLLATVTNAGKLVNTFAYAYDLAGNRLTMQSSSTNYTATYNALNEISTSTTPGSNRTNEWDALNRLVAVNFGNQRTEFTYDGLSRVVAIRKLVGGSEVSHRRLVWNGQALVEERDWAGVVTKRFFPQGMKIERGPAAGSYFYTRDHLGSIREITDGSGKIRARYQYDPYGHRTRLAGDLEADFGYAGMFFSSEANLSLTHYRAYDAELGRWLSRDPLRNAELSQGPNVYAYVANEPINRKDPSGLGLTTVDTYCVEQLPSHVPECAAIAKTGQEVAQHGEELVGAGEGAAVACAEAAPTLEMAVPAIEAEIPGLEVALPEAEALVAEGELGDRLMHLAADYRVNLPQLTQEIEAFEDAGGFSMRTWPPLMVNLDARFLEIAQDLATRLGISENEAWRIVARFVEFNPSNWPGQ